MKIMHPLLFTLLMSVGSATAWAAECTTSFYCYGSTASAVVRVNTRPPPIPPPNRRVVQQRQQAQFALRNRPTPRIARPAVATPAPQARVAAPVIARPTPRAAITVPRAQPIQQPAARAPLPPPNRPVGNCAALLQQASTLESQAVLASKRNDRQGSVMRFRDAANLRQQAARFNCG
jgi:hypothetical protein